jgi:hypothetical protein
VKRGSRWCNDDEKLQCFYLLSISTKKLFDIILQTYEANWSWIYSHSNHAKLDYDGSPVKQNGKSVTLMEWLAAQSK